MLRNTPTRYGLVARTLHWSLALLLVVLFGLGWWATELSYYDPLYRIVPDLHRALGLLAGLLIVLRLGWALYDRRPQPVAGSVRMQRAATAVHGVLYLLMVLLPITGYLMSTADGHAINVYGWFELPALLSADSDRGELAGRLHYLLGFGGAYLVLLHAAAALKHHFVDRDGTLRKMIG